MKSRLVRKQGRIAVWGTGYLGYTFVLKLQQHGFASRIWAPDDGDLALLREGDFPPKDVQFAWSRSGAVPALDPARFDIASDPAAMFDASIAVHVLALPNRPVLSGETFKLWEQVAGYAARYLPEGRRIAMILTAAPVPGDTEAFIHALGDAAGRVKVATAFRTDWLMEDFLYGEARIALGGTGGAAAHAEDLLDQLGVRTHRVGTVYEAEVLAASLNSLRYLVSAYVNQLTMAYPRNNFRAFADSLHASLSPSVFQPTLGLGGRRAMVGLEYLARGSRYSETLSILSEAQASSASMLITYADYLSRRKVSRVAILGITPQPDNRDLSLSPSLVLAEALMDNGVEVYVHDPLYAHAGIVASLPGVKELSMEDLRAGTVLGPGDAVMLMTPHRFYLEFTQDDIDRMFNGRISLLVDNGGAWSNFEFSGITSYHAVGDGSLDILE